MNEAQFQTKFNTWLKYRWRDRGTAKFELKITQGKSIPFDAVKPHQEANLAADRVIYKIPDVGVSPKPFDSFILTDCPGYVVLFYYRRGNKKFYIINIHDWVDKRETSSRKSLTEQEAESIAEIIGELA